jgi:arginyl-tRNA synthetase
MRGRIEQAVRDALAGLGAQGAAFVVERPRDMSHGDYATNAALVAKVDAQALADTIKKIDGVEKVEVAGKFVNFFLSREELVPKGQAIPQLYAGKQVLVEYTSPNLFKPLHIGNLIGNILGESVARLFEATGATVARLNYPSDIGLTIAKGVWGLQKNNVSPDDIAQLGQAYIAGNEAYESGAAKEEIETINKALYEDSNKEWSELRQRGIATSLRHLHELCAKLGTKKFDTEIFESESGPVGQEIVKAHTGSVFEVSEGATVYHGAHTRVFLNSQGLPTYEAKEVGLFKLKTDAYPNFDVSLTVTGKEQTDFFKVVFDAIRKLFPAQTAGKVLAHIPTSFLKLTTGKMSSRLGNVVTGESLLADLTEAARGREEVAVGAIKYAVLKSGSGRDIIFDPDKSLSLEGDSGPYVQYALVRAKSILKKVDPAFVMEDIDEKGYWMNLARILIHYPEAVERAAKEMEPHHVTTYLTELAAAFNSLYGAQQFVIEGKILRIYFKLLEAFVATMTSGLQVLGIPAPEEM